MEYEMKLELDHFYTILPFFHFYIFCFKVKGNILWQMEGCLCLRVNIWERENKTQKDKKQFLVRVNQREQIVQQTLTGFPCFPPCVISYLSYIFYCTS